MLQLSPPDPMTVGLMALAFVAGMSVPTYYAAERLAGFGRWAVKRTLPYEPPPGKTEGEQMEDAQPEGE